MWPLKFEIDVKGYTTDNGPYGDPGETFPPRKVRVFSWALVSGSAVEAKEFNTIVLRTTERLQVIAPPGTFRRPASGDVLEVVVIEGQEWILTDTEEKHEANPWWSPGLSVFWFDRDVADYVPPLPGDGGGPYPEEVPEAYKYNPYADEDNPLFEDGYGGGTDFFPEDDYNPYADEHSPFYTLGAGEAVDNGPYDDPTPAGIQWPSGQSDEARNAYQTTIGNVG